MDNYERHPSYGMISIGRTQGGSKNSLFGSSIPHDKRITISISTAEHCREINNDWYLPRKRLIEVDLSPSQFAEMISTAIDTTGVPCTIRNIQGTWIEAPHFENKRTIFEREFKDATREVSDVIADDFKCIADILSKKTVTKSDKEEILSTLRKLHQSIASNLPYVQDCFSVEMDKIVQDCKNEIDAFITQKIHSLGITALKKELEEIGMTTKGELINDSE